MKVAIIAGSGYFPIQIANENPDAFVLCIENHSAQRSFKNNSECCLCTNIEKFGKFTHFLPR